jgi:RNA polymerase sigma-70 factor (ECF subfamily)
LTAVGNAAPVVLAFQTIYDKCFTDVVRWVRALGASVADQDDVVQEVFIVVYRRLPYFDGNNLAAWLYRIAANQVRDFRRLSWIRQIFNRSVPLSSNLAATGPTPLRQVLDDEKRRLMARLLSKLNESQRTAFVLFEIHGYSGEEIARLQRVSINTVRARILRARKKLAALLLKWRSEARDALE